MSLIKLVKASRIVQSSKAEINAVLEEAVSGAEPEVKRVYHNWRQTSRFSTVAWCGLVAKQFYELEGKDLDTFSRAKAYIASATACLADDLIDNYRQQNPREAYFLDNRAHKPTREGVEKNLFYQLNAILQNLLPADFQTRFGGLIQRYNIAQAESRDLDQASPEKVVRIKDATGGYPFLLLYKILFSETAFDEGFNPDYNPKRGKLPITKSGAIFNFGAMVSRLDDLSDIRLDKLAGKKSLVSEGFTSWGKISRDIEFVRAGFNRFYPSTNVENVMGFYSPRALQFATAVNNAISRVRGEI